MTSFTGQYGPGLVVDYTLSPGLYTISSDGHETLVQKATVMTTLAFNHLIAQTPAPDAPDNQPEVEDW